MSDIRSATLSIKVIGDALTDIQNILNLYTKLEEKGKNPLVLKVDVATQNNLQAMNQTSNQIKKTVSQIQKVTPNINIGTTVGSAKDATIISEQAEKLEELGKSSEDTAEKVNKTKSSIRSLGDTMRAERFAMSGLFAAMASFVFVAKVPELAMTYNQATDELMKYAEARGWATEGLKKWLAEEERTPGVSKSARASIAQIYAAYASGPEEVERLTVSTEKFFRVNRTRLQELGITSATALAQVIKSGDYSSLKELTHVGVLDVGKEQQEALDSILKEYKGELPANYQELVDTRARQLALGKDIINQASGYGAIPQNTLTMWEDFYSNVTDAAQAIGDTMIPMMLRLSEVMKNIATFIEGNRWAAWGVGVVVTLTLIVSAVLVVANVFRSAWASVIGLWETMQDVKLAITKMDLLTKATHYLGEAFGVARAAASGFLTVLVAHPVIFVFVAIAAVLLLIAYRMGWLQKITESFQKALDSIDIGAIFQGDFSQIFKFFDVLKKELVKAFPWLSNPIVGIALKALFPPLILFEDILPKMLELINNGVDILRSVFDFLSKTLGWIYDTLRWVWESIISVKDAVLNIPNEIQKIIAGLPEAVTENDLINSLQNNEHITSSVRENPEQLKWLADYVSGNKVGTKPEGISDIDIQEAKLAYETARSNSGIIRNETVNNIITGGPSEENLINRLEVNENISPSVRENPETLKLLAKKAGGERVELPEYVSEADIREAEQEYIKEFYGNGVTERTASAVWDWLKGGAQNVLGPFDVGGYFASNGLFNGLVHESEEILPQAITKRGPGPIGKAIEELYNNDNSSQSVVSTPIININIDSPRVDSRDRIDELSTTLKNEIERLIINTMRRENRFFLRR